MGRGDGGSVDGTSIKSGLRTIEVDRLWIGSKNATLLKAKALIALDLHVGFKHRSDPFVISCFQSSTRVLNAFSKIGKEVNSW